MYMPYPVASSVVGLFANRRLVPSGTNLLLSRYDGTLLTIDGVGQTIPVAGVTLAPGAYTPGTLYYIYAYMASGVMTLEGSTTAPVQRNDNGMMAKTGELQKTLVGKAYCNSGPTFQDYPN